MAPQTVPITEADFLVTIDGLDYYFESFSGLDDQAQTVDWSDGIGNRLYKLVTSSSIAEFTLSKAFDPRRDKALVDFKQNYRSGAGLDKTISVVPVEYSPEPTPIGQSLILYGVKPTKLSFGKADKKSNAVSMLILSFVADQYKFA